MKNHLCLTVLLTAFASGVCLAQTDSGNNSPSLGELARKQHQAKKSAKVFTDEDLPSRSSVDDRNSGASSQNSATAPAATTADSGVTSPDKTAKGDKAASADNTGKKEGDAGSELKKKLDRYTAERDAWSQAAKRYEDLLADEKDQFRRQSYEDALSKDRHNAELYQAKIDEIQAQNKSQQDQPSDSTNGSGHK